MEFRNGLKSMGDAHSKVVMKFVEGQYDFDEAISAVQTSGSASEVFKRLNRFRMWMNKTETTEAINNARGEESGKIKFELRKIFHILNKY